MLDEFGAPKMINGKMPTKGDIKKAKQFAKKAKQDATKAKKEAKIAKKDGKILKRQSKPYQWPESPTKYSRVSTSGHRRQWPPGFLEPRRVPAFPLPEDEITDFVPEVPLRRSHHYKEFNGHFYYRDDLDKFERITRDYEMEMSKTFTYSNSDTISTRWLSDDE